MTPILTTDQRQAIQETGGKPVYLVDADTNISYVLLRADEYAKIQEFIGDEAESGPRAMYDAIDETFREGWDDPAMDAYDDYDAHQRSAVRRAFSPTLWSDA